MANGQTYIALLRGINVGGHHKVPMADLSKEMKKMGFSNVKTLLNSGNVIFDATVRQTSQLEKELASHLEQRFGFPIPVLVRSSDEVEKLIQEDPFKNIKVTKDIRLYVSFLREEPDHTLDLPWVSDDKSFHIIAIRDKTICSILDIAVGGTPKGMESLEKLFGKDITTRNWKTLKRISDKLNQK